MFADVHGVKYRIRWEKKLTLCGNGHLKGIQERPGFKDPQDKKIVKLALLALQTQLLI